MIMELFKSSRLTAVNNILFQTYFKGRKTGSVQSLEFLKKSWNLPCNFLDLEKVWKIEIKSGKNSKFFFKATTSALQVKFLSCWSNHFQSCLYVCSASLIKLCSCSYFKVSTAHLFDKCESEKRSYCFGKSLEKIWNFGSKNLFKPWKERLSYNCHYLTLTPFRYLV